MTGLMQTAMLGLGIFSAAVQAAAQVIPPVDSVAGTARLVVRTVPDSGIVFVNGRPAGRAPLTLDSLAAGMLRLSLIHPDTSNWLTIPVEDSLLLAAGETRDVVYVLPSGLLLHSVPEGATVIIGDSLHGTTPVALFPGTWDAAARILLRKPGYADVQVSPSLAIRGVLTVPLSILPGSPGEGPDVLVPAESISRTMKLHISGSVAVLAGIAAAYFKTEADKRQELYLQGKGDAFLSSRKTLDSAAGISLAISQISLVLFCYFLLAE
jgi:hypothetical protein